MLADEELDEEAKDRIRQWAWDNYKEGREPKPYWHEVAREEWIRINNNRRRNRMAYLTFYADDLEDYSFDRGEIECEVSVDEKYVGTFNADLSDIGIESVEVDLDSIIDRLVNAELTDEDRNSVREVFDITSAELSEHATGWLSRFDNDSETASMEDKLRGAKDRHEQLEEMCSHMAAIFRFLDPRQ